MDLFTLIKVVLSRWRVVVPIAMLTLGVAYLVQTTTPAEYLANGFLVLDAPSANGQTGASAVLDLEALAQGIEIDGDPQGRNFTVTAVGGSNYAIAAAAPSAERAEQDVEAVVEGLAERVRGIQEQDGVPDAARIELRLVDPQVVAEPQADGSFLATATVFLNDPAAVGDNPYPPSSYTGRLLEVALMGDSGRARFDALTGGGVILAVGQEARDAAPLIEIETTGSDPDAVIQGFYHARDIMTEDLSARQDRAGQLDRQRTTISILDAPLGVIDESPPVERATAAIVALGGLLALGVALALEGWERRSGPMGALRELVVTGLDRDLDDGKSERPADGVSTPPAERAADIEQVDTPVRPDEARSLDERLRLAIADRDAAAPPTAPVGNGHPLPVARDASGSDADTARIERDVPATQP